MSPESTTVRDGTFVFEWDGENRLKAMITRAEIGEFITPFRLDFAYDYMGRRIMKRYSRYEGDFHDLVETPGGELKSWASDYEQRFVWDCGLSGGYGNLSASYFYDSVENVFAGADQSYAWGPDLSGTEQGAGGIGGLAIISAAASDLNPTAATYVPLYDGHGNVVSLRDTSTNELAAYTYGPYGETTAAVGSRWASNPFRFSTKFTDAETGLVNYGYRYYMPSVGRWAGRDPIEERDGANLFAFVRNKPVTAIDALGLRCFKCGPAIDEWLDVEITLAFSWSAQIEQQINNNISWYIPVGARNVQREGARANAMLTIGPKLTYFPDTTFSDSQSPRGALCRNTVTVLGRCWHTSEIGNLIYGVITGGMGMSWSTAKAGAWFGNRGNLTNEDDASVALGWQIGASMRELDQDGGVAEEAMLRVLDAVGSPAEDLIKRSSGGASPECFPSSHQVPRTQPHTVLHPPLIVNGNVTVDPPAVPFFVTGN